MKILKKFKYKLLINQPLEKMRNIYQILNI